MEDSRLDKDLYKKYSHELYCILISLTSGEAKSILKSMADGSMGLDGYKGVLLFHNRFDVKAPARLLKAFLDVVKPNSIKNISEVVQGMHSRESKVAHVGSSYGEKKLVV